MTKRKLFLIAIFLLSSSLLFGETIKSVIPVTYAADIPNVIGFANSHVDYASPVDSLPRIYFKLNQNGEFSTGEFYMFWQLFSTDNVRITLSMAPMTNSNDTIHYAVDDIYQLRGLNTQSNDTGIVYDESGMVINKFRMSSMPISLVFQNADATTEGEYRGQLVLTLETL